MDNITSRKNFTTRPLFRYYVNRKGGNEHVETWQRCALCLGICSLDRGAKTLRARQRNPKKSQRWEKKLASREKAGIISALPCNGGKQATEKMHPHCVHPLPAMSSGHRAGAPFLRRKDERIQKIDHGTRLSCLRMAAHAL